MIVMKFGGTSVADAACMREVGGLVRDALPRSPLVVLSATARTTDQLFAAAQRAEAGDLPGARAIEETLLERHQTLARELLLDVPCDLATALRDLGSELDLHLRGVALLQELSPRSMDAIASVGERLSSRILAAHLGADWVDARDVMRTDAIFGSATPLRPSVQDLAAEHLGPRLGPGRAVVTQGYIGATAQGYTTTLGRGGSDFSASLFGAALGAEDIQIWTDVEGVLTCDPRIVPQAQPIAELGFREAAELAAFGAKVLHPATIEPAVERGIPVTVRHTRKPGGRFTTITGEVRSGRPVTALATRSGVTVLTVAALDMLNQSGFLARLFEVFARHKVSVDLIATAEVSVSLTVEADADLDALVADLTSFASVEAARDRAIVAVVGERLKATPGITGLAFGALRDVNVEMVSMGANEVNLSLVVRAEEARTAVARLHAALMEGSPA